MVGISKVKNLRKKPTARRDKYQSQTPFNVRQSIAVPTSSAGSTSSPNLPKEVPSQFLTSGGRMLQLGQQMLT